MKKVKQLHKNEVRLTPEEALQFLEDFAQTVHGRDQATKLISIRVPLNVLNSFKALAVSEGKKYQSVIVQLMRDWVKTQGK